MIVVDHSRRKGLGQVDLPFGISASRIFWFLALQRLQLLLLLPIRLSGNWTDAVIALKIGMLEHLGVEERLLGRRFLSRASRGVAEACGVQDKVLVYVQQLLGRVTLFCRLLHDDVAIR